MKIVRPLLCLAVLAGSLGCEMHPAPKSGHNGEGSPPGSGEQQGEPAPETVNPDPPSFFPTPKSG